LSSTLVAAEQDAEQWEVIKFLESVPQMYASKATDWVRPIAIELVLSHIVCLCRPMAVRPEH